MAVPLTIALNRGLSQGNTVDETSWVRMCSVGRRQRIHRQLRYLRHFDVLIVGCNHSMHVIGRSMTLRAQGSRGRRKVPRPRKPLLSSSSLSFAMSQEATTLGVLIRYRHFRATLWARKTLQQLPGVFVFATTAKDDDIEKKRKKSEKITRISCFATDEFSMDEISHCAPFRLTSL